MTVTISKVINAPAASQDLTTLAIVRDELNLKSTDTSQDAWLSRSITQASAVFARACNRVFWPELITETQQIQQDPYPQQTPGGVAPLVLTRWPLVAVNSVAQIYPINFNQPLTVDLDYSINTENGALTRLNRFTGVAVTWEAVPTIINYIAGYGSLVAEPQTVPASPYQIVPANASVFSFDNGVNYASGGAFTKVTGTPSVAGTYALSQVNNAWTYTFAPADQGASVLPNYAYANIPADLVEASLRFITGRFWSKDRDPNLMSIDQPNLGSKRFWVNSQTGENGAIPPEIMSLLTPYRVPAIA